MDFNPRTGVVKQHGLCPHLVHPKLQADMVKTQPKPFAICGHLV